MNCKHCNAELEEGMNFCPDCGAALTEPETEVTEVVETVETPEVVETPVETPAVEEKKAGLGAGKIALLVTLAVAAVAVVIALILGGKGGSNPAETTAPSTPAATNPTVAMTVPADGNPDDVTCKGSYSAEEKELKKQGDKVVATMGDAKLTNSELQVYYWMQVYDFLNQYGSYASMFGLDYTQPMDRQLSIDGKLTWQQYFLDSAVKAWSNYQAMALDAEANGYELEQEYADYLAELPANMADSAAQMGYENAEVMVQRDMGPGATMDGYMKYLSTYYLGYMYYGATMEQVAVTDADIEAYFDAHAAEYQENGLVKGEDRFVDVRHILISPEGGTADESGATVYSEEEWAAAEKKANEVMNEWLTKHPDEDGFAVMAETYTQDPGSATNGGLYEDVEQGQMVPEFDAWCFDASRQPGDYGIVKTTYGYHIMYFVGSDLVWKLTAENDLMAEKGNEFLQEILAKYTAEIDYSAIALGDVDLASAG
jgi:hypothetical protein